MSDGTAQLRGVGAHSAATASVAGYNRSRDVELFFQTSLLGMLASGFFAIAGSDQLDWPTLGVMLTAIVVRGLMIAGLVNVQIPARWIAILSAIYVLFYPIDYWFISLSFLTATVHMICFVAIAKILTSQTDRDHTFVKLIAILELSAAAVLSTHLSFFVCLTFFLLFAIATFASGEVRRSLQELEGNSVRSAVSASRSPGFSRRLGLLTCALFGGVLVLTAGMFFVLPRTARAAFQRFVPQRYHLPGFANEVTLGGMGELKQNPTPVMHVRSYQDPGGGRSNLTSVHWRGSALSRFDGKRWYNPPAPEQRLRVDRGELVLPSFPRTRPGRTVGYEIQLDEIASETLVFAGTPETISVQVPLLLRSDSGTLRAPGFGNRGLRYGAYSFLENDFAPAIAPPQPLLSAEQSGLLELPPLDTRIVALARQWTDGLVTRSEQARAIENHLRHDFSYSLKLLDEPVADPLANFLFVRKQGHCEYFASAMAVMLRSVGIPSRVATGFYGGVFNPMTGWQVVRASDAHSWVEAWIPDRGWTSYDPTPSDPSAASSELWSQTALFFDAADQFWRDWVMDYDLDHQVVLAGQLRGASRNFRLPAFLEALWSGVSNFNMSGRVDSKEFGLWGIVVAGLLILVALVGIFGKSWLRILGRRTQLRRVQRGEAQPGDATILYERALRLLETRGFQRPPWLTPEEFTRVLPSSELAILMEELTNTYNRVRFGKRANDAPRLAALLGSIETLLAK